MGRLDGRNSPSFSGPTSYKNVHANAFHSQIYYVQDTWSFGLKLKMLASMPNLLGSIWSLQAHERT